ncbi:U-box domain-containing protein [Drosera capensis]
MGTDVAQAEETVSSSNLIKVHRDMCTQLLILIERVSNLFKAIEAAQPRCSSGIQALCMLQNGIEKARGLVKSCCESSKLYLAKGLKAPQELLFFDVTLSCLTFQAITGDTIVSRCQRTKNLWEQSLTELQTMVPVALELKISQAIEDFRHVVFVMHSSEAEVSTVLRTLLKQDKAGSDSIEASEIAALQLAASTLHLTSQKDLLIEKRSIRKLLDKVTDTDQTRKSILKYLLYLLKKYEKMIVKEQARDSSLLRHDSLPVAETPSEAIERHAESYSGYSYGTAQPDTVNGPTPPEEFRCPISLSLMFDPVVIASGQTFERACIQKWFDEGHVTCPRTRMKLAHFSLTPNTSMKILISKWCAEHRITVTDPRVQQSSFSSYDVYSSSITSSGSSLKDLHLQIDLSHISLGTLDSYSSDSFHSRTENGLKAGEKCEKLEFFSSVHELEQELLSKISTLPWEAQCMVTIDIRNYLEQYSDASLNVSTDNFFEPLLGFFKDAAQKCDVEAQKSGVQLLSIYLRTNRRKIQSISQDMYNVLASFLETEAAEETLTLMELFSVQENCGPKLEESGALSSILRFLDCDKPDFQISALIILENLSSRGNNFSSNSLHESVQRLVPLLSHDSLAGHCITILKNLCDIEATRVSITETKGCIASIAERLEYANSKEEQEHAVYILLSLCSQRVQYCQLVMEEGIIPTLVSLSINGNDKGKMMALELLRILRDIFYDEPNMEYDSNVSNGFSDSMPEENLGSRLEDKVPDGSYEPSEAKILSSKKSGFFGRKLAFLSKPGSISGRKKK